MPRLSSSAYDMRASEKTWERQDMIDIGALSSVAAYCDIAVTERLWVDLARRAKLDERFGTIFVRDLADLPALIV